MASKVLTPVIFSAHGGGPMPLLGDKSHASLLKWWRQLGKDLKSKPKAVVVISAHWEEPRFTVQTAPKPPMLFDYYGFPAESYEYKYAAENPQSVNERVLKLLKEAKIDSAVDSKRGFDHGVYVPFLAIFPEADIPMFQISLKANLNVKDHLELGRALAPLREEGVLLFGSGMSYHNMRGFNLHGGPTNSGNLKASESFDKWLLDTLQLDGDERDKALQEWTKAPNARACHPREEHLVPLFVCVGAAMKHEKAKVVWSDLLLGVKVSSFEFSSPPAV